MPASDAWWFDPSVAAGALVGVYATIGRPALRRRRNEREMHAQEQRLLRGAPATMTSPAVAPLAERVVRMEQQTSQIPTLVEGVAQLQQITKTLLEGQARIEAQVTGNGLNSDTLGDAVLRLAGERGLLKEESNKTKYEKEKP